MGKVNKTDREWQRLSPEEYRITRKKGTEPAFTGQYWNIPLEAYISTNASEVIRIGRKRNLAAHK